MRGAHKNQGSSHIWFWRGKKCNVSAAKGKTLMRISEKKAIQITTLMQSLLGSASSFGQICLGSYQHKMGRQNMLQNGRMDFNRELHSQETLEKVQATKAREREGSRQVVRE